jgi:hypothetical protein
MTFLAPLFLAAGAAVAGAIVLLHFLARRRPRPAVLPTARFVPDRPARWPSRAPRPTDLPLLALRVLAIVTTAAAFAQPMRVPARAAVGRVVLVDRSRSVGDERSMRDSVLAVLREGDVLIAFDTIAHTIIGGIRDSVPALARSRAPSSLTVALLAAQRAAATLRDRADSIELVVVSPLDGASWDDATALVRARWAGRIRVVPVPLSVGDTTTRGIAVRAPPSDAVAAAAAPFIAAGDERIRVVREAPSVADSTWVGASRRVLVHWPRAHDAAQATAQAVVGSDLVLAAPLVRHSRLEARSAHVIARFADGSPAVNEHVSGAGCIRDVGFDFPLAGDVPLRESSRRLVAALGAPCTGDQARARLSVTRLDSLRGGPALLATSALPRLPRERNAATPWLLIAGALLLIAEVGVRQRMGRQ